MLDCKLYGADMMNVILCCLPSCAADQTYAQHVVYITRMVLGIPSYFAFPQVDSKKLSQLNLE